MLLLTLASTEVIEVDMMMTDFFRSFKRERERERIFVCDSRKVREPISLCVVQIVDKKVQRVFIAESWAGAREGSPVYSQSLTLATERTTDNELAKIHSFNSFIPTTQFI